MRVMKSWLATEGTVKCRRPGARLDADSPRVAATVKKAAFGACATHCCCKREAPCAWLSKAGDSSEPRGSVMNSCTLVADQFKPM